MASSFGDGVLLQKLTALPDVLRVTALNTTLGEIT